MSRQEYESLQERYLEHFPDSIFAMRLQCLDDEDADETETPLERYLLEDSVYFDVIPFICGCVDPKAVAREFYKALASRAWTDKNGERHGHSHYEADGWSEQGILHLTMLYLLDNMGYTDHGSSVYSSWLTPKGVVARDIIKAHFDCTLGNNMS